MVVNQSLSNVIGNHGPEDNTEAIWESIGTG